MQLKLAPIQVYESWYFKPKWLKRKQPKKIFWTEEEIVSLVSQYNQGYTAKEIAKQLKRTPTAVRAKIFHIRHDQELINSKNR